MAYAFDTLGYARTLRDAGIPQEQAEAHADAAREFIMAELVTKQDLATFEKHIATTLELHAHQILVRIGGLIVAAIAATGVLVKMMAG
ncbi:hypothetical protein [Enterovirga rhinocerotis]|uniref:DUF1640 domain-containing protein n=1 Tax=Enterovirga rhinocerotis TaxID=1339210 RepID=A0A4R7BP14_9HYPH|nr:hypothetical protein [Enterovirga rhinocerotis]TDR87290.1 hypothetical protein EV668_4371 [Enterovirga rhinocerotis]